jgi:hypothetical protein
MRTGCWVLGEREGRVWYGMDGVRGEMGRLIRTLTFVRASKMGSLRTMVDRLVQCNALVLCYERECVCVVEGKEKESWELLWLRWRRIRRKEMTGERDRERERGVANVTDRIQLLAQILSHPHK